MAEHDDDSPSPDSSAVPVPELIEQYRSRRQAWMAQADELARLRDEVRGSAEREAMEIVTAARRDIRRIVGEARRDLFVLSAQVQAAVGDLPPGARSMRPALPAPMDERDSADDLSTFAEEEWGFAPRATVKSVLDEALADMAVLAKDASAVQVRPPESATAPAVEIPAEQHEPEAVSGLLLSPFGADGAEPRSTRPITPFLIGSVAVGIVVVAGTIWAIRGPASSSSQPAARGAARTDAPSTVTPQASSAGPGGSTAGTPAAAADSGIRLSLEARRPAWIRAIVDGRPDPGYTLRQGEVQEFRGARSIALRIGDAGAVLVSVNGEQPRLLGRDGQVVNREFTGRASEPARPAPVRPSATGAPEPTAVPELGSGPSAAAPLPATPIQAASANLSEASPSSVIGTNGVEASPTTRPPERTDATSTSSTSAAGSSATAATAATAEATLVAAAQQWLDAYYRQDRGTLASLSTDALIVTDERPTAERFPTGVGTVVRTLERVNVRAAADTAVLTGIMVERAAGGGLQRSSPVSLLWVSGSGTWRLWQARLVSESRLNQIFR